MLPDPYRTPARRSPPDDLPRFLDLVPIAAFTWLITLVRVSAALVRGEPASRELDIAWLLVFAAPVLILAELRAAGATQERP